MCFVVVSEIPRPVCDQSSKTKYEIICPMTSLDMIAIANKNSARLFVFFFCCRILLEIEFWNKCILVPHRNSKYVRWNAAYHHHKYHGLIRREWTRAAVVSCNWQAARTQSAIIYLIAKIFIICESTRRSFESKKWRQAKIKYIWSIDDVDVVASSCAWSKASILL